MFFIYVNPEPQRKCNLIKTNASALETTYFINK